MVKDSLWLLLLLLLGACSLLPDKSKDRISSGGPFAPPLTARQCLAALDKTGARFTPLPDQDHGRGCTTINTVQISSLKGDSGKLSASNLGPVACEAANDFADWARDGADKAARKHLGSGIAKIETMGTYSCRNVAGTGRRSGHARAEAIDVSGFVLKDGRRISVLKDWNGGDKRERAFLRAAQASACDRFNMVLGPDYNAAHANHFHLESGSGQSGWGSFRSYCR